jgi:hypothetical protein
MSKRLLLASLLVSLPVFAAAQPPPTPPPGARNVEVDPIRCWWRTSAGSVRIGEPFDVVLTCAVLESDAVSVVVDESRLGNAVVQMAPFEVIGGAHPADLHAGLRRFFQYEYKLRLINPDVVGQDVALPEIGLHYRVNSRVAGNAAVEGRDLLYYLPAQAIRIQSLVPNGAADIRDATGASFAKIDELAFRAGVFNILAIALMALGGLMILAVLVRLARGSRKRTPADQRELSTGRLLGVATRALAGVKSERESSGWNDDLIERALSATRVAAAGALGRSISQRTVPADLAAGEGRLFASGPRRGTKRIVSAPTTGHDLARALARLSEADSRRPTLDALRDALSAFSAAQYGRAETRDESALDDALAAASQAAARVRAQHAFPRNLFRRWSAGAAPMESQA